MDCSAYREAISARIDGENTGLEAEAIDAHLRACPNCRSWAQTATAVTRQARVGLAEPVPDLTASIMAAIAPPGPLGRSVARRRSVGRSSASVARRRSVGRSSAAAGRAAVSGRSPAATGRLSATSGRSTATTAASPVLVARMGLVFVAGAQLCLAVPELLGYDTGASVHIAHEQGSWALALAVGLVLVAVRPARAAAMLPLVAALATGLAFTMAVDIAAGRTQAAAEAPHGLAFLGLGLLWLLTRQIHGVRSRVMPRTS